jgi:muramidase (phage lysozyme)
MRFYQAMTLSSLLLGCNSLPNAITVPQNNLPRIKSPRYIIPADEPAEKQPSIDDVIVPKEEPKVEKRYFDNLTPEYRALLDTISWAEATSDPCKEGVSQYQVLVIGVVMSDPNNRYGGKFEDCVGHYFNGFDDHPRIRVKWHRKARISSTAAGRYQWMEFTFDRLRNKKECGPMKDEDCGLFKDFSPDEQDRAAIHLIQREERLTQYILEEAIKEGKPNGKSSKYKWKKSKFRLAIKQIAKVWASFPYYYWHGRGVGFYPKQRNSRSLDKIFDTYMTAYEKYGGDVHKIIPDEEKGLSINLTIEDHNEG